MQTQQKTPPDRLGNRPAGEKPQARLDFAQRLRELRVPRGYRTARSLARALGIDENRYTRYERAEVEPDLALIRRMCQVLGITPTELLGTVDGNGALDGSSAEMTGSESQRSLVHHSASVPMSRDEHPVGGVRMARAVGVEFAAWQLACAAAEARLRTAPGTQRGQEPSSVALLANASPIYSRLREAPFEVIAEIAADRSIAAAPPGVSAKVLAAIDALVGALGSSGP